MEQENNQPATDKEVRPFEALVMPRWMKQPHLFANGMFDIKFNKDFENIGKDSIWKLNADKLSLLEVPEILQDSTLIARPIKGIVNYEFEGALQALGGKTKANIEIVEAYIDHGQPIKHHISLFLFLLSIGIYPFDQTDFYSEHLIDARAV